MKSWLSHMRAGMAFGSGVLLVLGLGALLAQTFSNFSSGDVLSAVKINENFSYLRGKVDSPLPMGDSAGIASVNLNGVGSTFVDVSGLSVNVVSSGSPVWLALLPLGNAASSIKIEGNAAGNGCAAQVAFLRNGAIIAIFYLQITHTFTTDSVSNHYMPSALWTIDAPGPGTHAYKVQVRDLSGGNCRDITFTNVKLAAMRFNEN